MNAVLPNILPPVTAKDTCDGDARQRPLSCVKLVGLIKQVPLTRTFTVFGMAIALSGCGALDFLGQPNVAASNGNLPNAAVPSPNQVVAPATLVQGAAAVNAVSATIDSSGGQTSTQTQTNGFSLQNPSISATPQLSDFPEGILDLAGTVGRYQVGPSYTLNGLTITPSEQLTLSQIGMAGWYGDGFEGATTANGEVLKDDLRTFAHRTLPFGTIARLTNLANGHTVVARVNDRGPIEEDRLIDVSTRITQDLSFGDESSARVQLQVLEDETRRFAQLTGGIIQTPANSGAVGGSGDTAPSSTPTAIAPVPVTPVAAAPSAAAPVASEPASSPASSSAALSGTLLNPGQVYVQAGTFCDQVDAARLQALLQPIGTTNVQATSINGEPCFAVIVGPYSDESDARIALGRIVAAGAMDASIRRDG